VTVQDEEGRLHHLAIAPRGGGALPARAPRRGTTTLVLRAVLPVGNGQLRWAPAGGAPVVSWDFDVEID
jgi:hypothetical protein